MLVPHIHAVSRRTASAPGHTRAITVGPGGTMNVRSGELIFSETVPGCPLLPLDAFLQRIFYDATA